MDDEWDEGRDSQSEFASDAAHTSVSLAPVSSPQAAQPQTFRPKKRLAGVLFIATCLSTWLTGSAFFATNNSLNVQAGLSYSASLMAILMFHEMGHYLQARRWNVPATLPYFIPMPMLGPFGTMGAVIVQGAGVADRRSLFDIAITGPLAGLVVAIPVTFYGISISEHLEIGEGAMVFSNPLLLEWMYAVVHEPLPPRHDMLLNPYLFAGWVGIFITGLNLIPIGQLDGGHILYTLIGRRTHVVSYAVLGTAIAYMIVSSNYSFVLMIVLLLLMGPRHPPTANDRVPLGWFRIIIGWLSLAFVFVGLTPEPLKMLS